MLSVSFYSTHSLGVLSKNFHACSQELLDRYAEINVENNRPIATHQHAQLKEKILTEDSVRLRLRLRIRVAYDVLRAIAYLHSQRPPLVHNNIHSGNVFLKQLITPEQPVAV